MTLIHERYLTMIKYYPESEQGVGFILDYTNVDDIITAKVLLVLPDIETCIDIISTPLPDYSRIISIPDWNFSCSSTLCSNDLNDSMFSKKCGYSAQFKELLALTISIMHNSIMKGSQMFYDDRGIYDNKISTVDDLMDFCFENQGLPF